jgi:tetratricopeptide (TPR) repeat protein
MARLAPVALGLLVLAGVAAGYGLYRQSTVSRVVDAPAVPIAPPRAAERSAVAAPDKPREANEAAFMEPSAAGSVAYQGGEYERSLALYMEAVKKNPDDAEAWSNLGQVLVRLERPAEAIPHFERAVGILPTRWAYHFNLARAHGLLNDWPKAVESYRAAQRLYPEDYAIAFNLGLALRKTGDHPGAIDQFQKAISLDPQDPTFHLSLAMSYEALDRPEEAAAEYRKTLELAPEAPEAPQIRTRIERLVQ